MPVNWDSKRGLLSFRKSLTVVRNATANGKLLLKKYTATISSSMPLHNMPQSQAAKII